MYHYVRPIKKSNYPKINGLELDGFKRQLDYLKSIYNFITAEQLISYSKKKIELPDKPCYLTFDDGFKDHLEFVLPELLSRNIQGSFFPPSCAIENREMLDVHSIQYIIACTKDSSKLVIDLDNACLERGLNHEELSLLKKKWAVAGRWDGNTDIRYIKSLLQHVLPSKIRTDIVSYLFKKHVNRDKYDFANDLYLSISDIKKLIGDGMHIGSHGYKHLWLNKISKEEQVVEIENSLNFLDKLGISCKNWIMCYPSGAYNSETLKILKDKNCAIGLTDLPGIVNLGKDNFYELTRFDTNFFPQ